MTNRFQDNICYIGKSNDDFTYSKLYGFYGKWLKDSLSLTIYGNKRRIYFNDDYLQYFEDNFKFVDENEYHQLIRKAKLKKISNKKRKNE